MAGKKKAEQTEDQTDSVEQSGEVETDPSLGQSSDKEVQKSEEEKAEEAALKAKDEANAEAEYQAEDGMVQVKILKHVGAYVPGQVVTVDAQTAKHLTHVNEIDDGIGGIQKNVRAMYLDKYEDLEAASLELSDLTAAEAAELGIKNVTDSSSNPISIVNKIEE